MWASWCEENNINPMDLLPVNVAAFLSSHHNVRATRQRQLSALRQLAQMLTILSPGDKTRAIYEALKKLKIPDANLNDFERERRALNTEEVKKILAVFSKSTLLEKRNRAIVAILFGAGIRRSDCASLQWQDINFDTRVITLRHSKRNKRYQAAILLDQAIVALRRWQSDLEGNRVYIFCKVVNGRLGADKPINSQTVYRCIEHVEKLTGITLTPHTARRTLITDLLNNDAPPQEAQAQAGHASPITTIGIYGRPVEAAKRHQKLKLTYG